MCFLCARELVQPPPPPYPFFTFQMTNWLCRNFETVYDVLLREYDTWPFGVRVVFEYLGTVAFGVMLALGLL